MVAKPYTTLVARCICGHKAKHHVFSADMTQSACQVCAGDCPVYQEAWDFHVKPIGDGFIKADLL